MEFRDFVVGEPFYTGSGGWVVEDIGELFIYAVKISDQPDFLRELKFNGGSEFIKAFDSNDFGGCRLTDSFGG